MIGVLRRTNKNKLINMYYNKNRSLTNLNKKISNENKINSVTFKIDNLKMQLKKSQAAEQNIQEGISFLQEKSEAVNSLKDISKALKDLSVKYNSNDSSINDKQAIEEQAKQIIDNMNDIMNTTFGSKSTFSKGEIIVETNHASNIIINTSLDISIDSNADKGTKNSDYTGIHIEGNLSIEDILNNTNRIENNLIKPLNKYSDEVSKQMISLANDVMYQDMSIKITVKKLSSLNAIDGYTATTIINNSDIILKNASNALYSQSFNLDKDSVKQLIE